MQGLNIKLDINIEIEEENIIETEIQSCRYIIQFIGAICGLKFKMSYAVDQKFVIQGIKDDLRRRMLSPNGIYDIIPSITITVDGFGDLYFKGKSISEIIEILIKNNYVTWLEVTNYD